MTSTLSKKIEEQIQRCLNLLQNIMGQSLLGAYLYGSSVLGGLQKYSDIDLFVVSDRSTTPEEKAKLVINLLQVSGIYMKGEKLPIEITIVTKSEINPWHYPPHFDFQYGDWLRNKFEAGIIEPWSTKEMPDLAIIITQILLKSQTLWGLEPELLLVQVPYPDFIKAMLYDLHSLAIELEHDTRNVLLTYARIWSTLETNAIRSKPAAADWVMHHLPEVYRPVIERAKLINMGLENEYWDDVKVILKPCADFMTDKINAKVALINFNDTNQLITLAEESYS